jgi:hypothetical protein
LLQSHSAGDLIPTECEVIDVRLADLRQLFNPIDPAPFRDRDLDPKVEEFIVDWGREAPAEKPLALIVRLDKAAGAEEEPQVVRDAIHQFFAHRAVAARRRLRRLFRVGRISLAIGLAALAVLFLLAQVVMRRTPASAVSQLLQESLLIGGWVAMWRPLEIFLYEWWPIRAEAKLYDRLAAMPVRIMYARSQVPDGLQS